MLKRNGLLPRSAETSPFLGRPNRNNGSAIEGALEWPPRRLDGISDFNALHSRKHDHEVRYTPSTFSRWAATTCGLCPYTCARRTWSSLARGPDGITVAPFERGEIGPDLFRAACRMGLEGLVSKQRERPYQAGRSRHSVKVKNRQHPAMRYGLSRHQNSG